ncbi:type VI secretion system tip protein VgrG, partial [Paraburkholderia tropica]
VSLRPDGFYVYTNGQHLIHAAGHATADAQGQPVQFPVTPDSPGKYALHPVLVEHGGGFAIPNQPYRMTLDDGQVITGTTTEHGELSVVTSNAVVFGTVELLSQSEPDHVIGITNVTVSRDAAAPVPAQISDLQPRKAVVGGKTISTPSEVDTTQSKPPAFLACDPMNFGLRTSRYATKPRTTIVPREPGYSTTVEYPVAKTYALAVKEKFNAIDWKGLAGKSLVDIQGVIVPAMQGALWGALQTGPFGLPKGNAMPSIEIVDIISAKKYNMLTDVTASFMSKQWVMGIYESYINEIIGYALNDDKAYFEAWKGGLASALYHEARHCQQIFWMVSLFNTYPDDYSKYSKIGKYFSDTVNINIFSLASETRFPNDDRVRVGMHALLMFYYYWQITEMRNKPGYTYVNEDFENVEKAVCTIRGVTPEIARKMAPHDSGYYAHLHEEDAYATGEPVSSYWTNANTLFMREPGLCTEKYSTYLAKVGVKGNV